jgi:NADH-quinone oxidoreductase subunit M
VAQLKDVGAREGLVLALLAAAVLLFGIYPQPMSEVMRTSVGDLLEHVAKSKLP